METKEKQLIVFVVISLLIVISIPTFVFQKAFAQETVLYQVTGNQVSTISCSGAPSASRIFEGETLTASSSLVGLTADRIRVGLEADGAPSGATITIGVWSTASAPTTSNALHVFGTIDNDEITTDMLFYNFTSTDYTFVGNSAVGVFLNAADAECIRTSTRNADVFDTTNSVRGFYTEGTGWGTSNTNEFAATIVLTEQSASEAFCEIPANESLLRCRLEEQGGALGGNFANNPFDISNSSSSILIQVGFLDGSDDNPATNGTGYLLLAIALVIVNTLLWIGTGGAVFSRSSIFLPALVSLVIVMGFTVGGLVDATALIISILALVALSAPKIVEIISSSRGGGSTA